MALTPQQWLDRLALAMDERAARLLRLRSYMNGDAPLPEGAEGCRDAYKAFQRKARTNFGELIVDAVGDNMIPAGFSFGGENQDNDQLREIWKRNRLQIGMSDVVRDMLGLSAGYMIVSESAPRTALITCERPEQVITEQSASRPDQVRAALKVYRDPVEAIDVAYLHLPGVVYTFTRPFHDQFGKPALLNKIVGGWVPLSAAETHLDFIPVFPFINRGGIGEFESHTDILDRINWNILQRLVITAMQAYRQRGIKGDLPVEDDAGNPIDYAELFKPGPGALWFMPEGTEMWESSPTDITASLAANRDDITHLAAVTRTPMPMLIPDGANQSAKGSDNSERGLIKKSRDRIERAKAELNLVMGAAWAIETGSSSIVDGIESLWQRPDEPSLAERADAATKAQDLPWRTRMRDIWGYSEDVIDAMESERASDALNAALAFPTTQPTLPASGTAAA